MSDLIVIKTGGEPGPQGTPGTNGTNGTSGMQPPVDTTVAALGAITNPINTADKARHKLVADENDRVWRALGALNSSKWRPLDDQSGLSDITPA